MLGDWVVMAASVAMTASKMVDQDYKEVIIWVIVGLWAMANYVDRRLDDR